MAETTKIQWCEIPGHEGYAVDPTGKVASRWRRKGAGAVLTDSWRALKTPVNANGYPFLNLGRGNTRTVHRLVLKTFVGPCPEGQESRHLNGNRLDNRLENLAWGFPSENHTDQYLHGTRVAGARHPQSKLTALQVKAARALSEIGWRQDDIGELFGIAQPTVSSLVNRKHRVTHPDEVLS